MNNMHSICCRQSITSFIILFKVARGFADVKTGFSDIGLITNSIKWFSLTANSFRIHGGSSFVKF